MTVAVGVADSSAPYADALRRSRRELAKNRTPYNMTLHASLLQLDGKFDEASVWADRCLREHPHYAQAQYLKALLAMLDGDYERGFALHESRLEVFGAINGMARQGCRWNGKPSNKIVFCWQEGGVGDAIQYARWWPQLLSRCPNAVLSVQRNVYNLFRFNFSGRIVPTLDVSEFGKVSIAADQQCSMMSLPYLLGVTTVSGAPYLQADQELIEHWRKLLIGKPRIGFCWKGSPRHERDLTRSIKDETAFDFGIHHDVFSLLPEHSKAKTFADTAAIIANLDMVVTVDTSVAHLGGAMGKPTWVLLPFDVDYRWQKYRSDSPWYDSVRLFRCPAHGAWDAVIDEVGDLLSRR